MRAAEANLSLFKEYGESYGYLLSCAIACLKVAEEKLRAKNAPPPADPHEELFWDQVTALVRDVLGGDPGVVARYRDLLSAGSDSERSLVLHDDPRNVALELTGIAMSDDERLAYFKTGLPAVRER